ncbi:MFS transporter [Actinopolymorpha sp. B17G11]|uniref:MFS transporter n=1 Tax=Actinopolymorpha sp. B17G11 TaxID=3160861 RepID=UPI0032E43369
MLEPYRALLRLPGTLKFSASGLLGRLPISMVALGIIILVSARTGSYGIAGSVAAAYVIARSACSPLQARLVDRYGQRRMLPLIAFVHAATLGGLVVVVDLDLPVPVLHVLAALAGGSSPTIGSYVRARWNHLLGNTPELQTAFALEAVVDELLFMIGPPVVTLLATAVNPSAGILVALASGFAGTLLLASLRGTEPPAHGRSGAGTALQPLGWRLLLPVVAASVGIGTLFGAFDISVIALASEQDARAWSGVLLAITATGSMLAAAILGGLRLRRSASARFRIGTVAIAVAILPLPFINHLGVLAVIVFGVGFTISPTLIASTARVSETVPTSRLAEGLAWTTSAVVGGIALGGAVAGQVIDHAGASAGFVVSIAAGVLAAAAALASPRGNGPGQMR